MLSDAHPYSPINVRVSEDDLQAIVYRIVDERAHLSDEHRDRVRTLLRSTGHADDDADPFQVPSHRLRRILCSAGARSESVAEALFAAWCDLRAEVILDLQGLLAERGVDPTQAPSEALVDEISAARPDLPPSTVTLLLAYLRAGGASESGRSAAQHPPLLTGWLASLVALPPSADEWAHLDWFVEALHDVAVAKQHEHALVARQQALAQAVDEVVAALASCPMLPIDPSRWSVDRCHESQVDEALALVQAVATLISTYTALHDRPTADLEELRDRLAGLTTIVQQIDAPCRRLDVILAGTIPSTAGEAPSAEGDSRGPAVPPAAPDHASRTPHEEPAGSPVTDATEPPERDDHSWPTPMPGVGGAVAQAEILAEAVTPWEGWDDSLDQSGTSIARAYRTTGTPRRSRPARCAPEPIDGHALWTLLDGGDHAGAYWLARACEETGCQPPVPSWLLRMVTASVWLVRGEERIESDLLSMLHTRSLPDDLCGWALGTGAALVAALSYPFDPTPAWLATPPPPFDLLEPVLAHVRDVIAGGAMPLKVADVRLMHSQRALEAELSERAADVARWLTDVPKRIAVHLRVKSILEYLCGDDGEIGELFAPIVRNQYRAVDATLPRLARWRERTYLITALERAERTVLPRGASYEPLEGMARRQLLADVQEGVELASAWARLAQRWQEIANRSTDRAIAQARQLVDGLNAALPDALAGLRALMTSEDVETRALARYLLTTLQVLADDAEPAPAADVFVPALARGGLEAGLSQRLHWLPTLQLDGEARLLAAPTSNDWPYLPDALLATRPEPHYIRDAVAGWLAAEDFRWVDGLLDLVEDEIERTEMHTMVDEARDVARVGLLEHAAELDWEIEESVLGESLDAGDGARLTAEVEALRGHGTRGQADVGEVRRRLDDLGQQLRERRMVVVAEYWAVWRERRQALLERLPIEHRSDAERLVATIDEALERDDLVILDEALAWADQMAEGTLSVGAPVEYTAWLDERTGFETFSELMASRAMLSDFLEPRGGHCVELTAVERLVRTTGDPQALPPALGLSSVSAAQIAEVADALAAWTRLKQAKTIDGGDVRSSLMHVVRYLGFAPGVDGEPSVRLADRGQGWALYDTGLPLDMSVAAALGGQVNGRLEILCLWGRPSISTFHEITGSIRPQPDRTRLVIYLDRLSQRSWDELRWGAARHNLRALVIDELLFLYLARTYDRRLSTLLACGLPMTAVNPFAPAVGTGVSSQTLAPQGPAPALAPLDLARGRELIRHLEMLGFGVSERLSLRILSLTAGQPVLIRAFCSQLVALLRWRMPPLPYDVTLDDVQTVYRQSRPQLRQLFALMLDRDPRAGVLARAMVVDQLSTARPEAGRGRFARTSTLPELLELGRAWWPEGFTSLNDEAFRDLIDGLVRTGLLAPSAGGQYRLRSRSVVRLLGSRDTLEAYLEPFILGGLEGRDADGDAAVGSVLLRPARPGPPASWGLELPIDAAVDDPVGTVDDDAPITRALVGRP